MIHINNLKKQDNKKWKLIADTALYSLPFLSTAVLTMPVSDNTQKWIIFGINFSVVIFKAISKLTTNEEISVNSDNTTFTIQSGDNTQGSTTVE